MTVNGVDGPSYGLRPRPEPDPAVLAAVAAAVSAIEARPATLEEPGEGRHRSWRFSGRWWSRPLPVRRNRPWIG